MKKRILNIVFCTLVLGFLMFLTIPFQSCNPKNDKVKYDTIIKHDTVIIHDTIIKIKSDNNTPINKINNNYNTNIHHPHNPHKVYKPNIYIHPKKDISLKVIITFPKTGAVTKSIPLYNKGWNIKVDSTGKINKTYNYLFYESNPPDNWQYKSGWIIEKDSLKVFFQKNLKEYGFDTKEIIDFTDYWIPRLNKNKYYLIYPQEKEIIDNLIQVNYSIKPDNILRLFYAIKGTNVISKIDKHIIKNNFKRTDFYVTEWGVILK